VRFPFLLLIYTDNCTDALPSDIWFTMTFANNPKIFSHIVESHQTMVDEWKANESSDFITQAVCPPSYPFFL
jgi:hypothetical protein